MVIKTYPDNPDFWCEVLKTNSGEWVPYSDDVSNNTLSIDNVRKVAGTASVKTHTVTRAFYDSYSLAKFQLTSSVALFDGTQKDAKIKFAIQLGSLHNGGLTIILVSSNNVVALKTVEGLPRGEWLDLGFLLGSKGEWFTLPDFDWTKIESIIFQPHIGSITIPVETDFWIDNMHFEYDMLPTSLTIFSTDIEGKAVYKLARITSPQGLSQTINLPFGPANITPTGKWSIEILSTDFIKWQDTGSTDKTRTFDATGTPISFTAIFQVGEPPPTQIPSWLPLLGATSVILIISYYLYRKYKG